MMVFLSAFFLLEIQVLHQRHHPYQSSIRHILDYLVSIGPVRFSPFQIHFQKYPFFQLYLYNRSIFLSQFEWAHVQHKTIRKQKKVCFLWFSINEAVSLAKRISRFSPLGPLLAAASYVPALTKKATKIAEKIGKVHVEMGGTACKVPLTTEYIQKIIDAGRIGKKRKMARC